MEKTANDVKGLVKHFHMVQTQLEQITKVQKDLLAGIPIQNKQTCGVITSGGTATQDPLYPEGHPKRTEQESQLAENNIAIPPKKKKKTKKHK